MLLAALTPNVHAADQKLLQAAAKALQDTDDYGHCLHCLALPIGLMC
jgi:hypothetical protein